MLCKKIKQKLIKNAKNLLKNKKITKNLKKTLEKQPKKVYTEKKIK